MVFFKSLTKEVLSKHLNNVFIETGSQYGHGIDIAIKCGFTQIHSIDIDPKYHDHCIQRFPQEFNEGFLKLYIGDSAVELSKILMNVNEPATFWLDAHADYGIIGKAKCPVLLELEQIKLHHIRTHTILLMIGVCLANIGVWVQVKKI